MRRFPAQHPIGVVHVGLGPIGQAIASVVQRRRRLRSLGAYEVRPDLIGLDLGDLIGAGRFDLEIEEFRSQIALSAAQVALHSTTSSLQRATPELITLLESGLSVISTCEELAYPWNAAPELADQLHVCAKERGIALLGTGVNPGFAMDYLPLVLSGASQTVRHVRVLRVQDAGARRVPLQRKVGAGLDRATFDQRVSEGVIRHVGLAESAHALASAFGWSLSELREDIEPILAESPTKSGLGEIPIGNVTGVRQKVVGRVDGREVLRLALEMAVGLPDARDEVEVAGDPGLHMIIPGGIHGDRATAAVAVNAVERLVAAEPGLRTMADLPPVHP